MPSHIPRPEYAETGIPEAERVAKRSSLIRQLTPEEIEGMRKACRVRKERQILGLAFSFYCCISLKFGREVLDIAAANTKPGVTTDEIDRIVHEVNYCKMYITFIPEN